MDAVLPDLEKKCQVEIRRSQYLGSEKNSWDKSNFLVQFEESDWNQIKVKMFLDQSLCI